MIRLITKLFCLVGWHELDVVVEADTYDGSAWEVIFCRNCGVETSFENLGWK